MATQEVDVILIGAGVAGAALAHFFARQARVAVRSSGAAARAAAGIQTSPAMGQACAALLLGRPLPTPIADPGFSLADLAARKC